MENSVQSFLKGRFFERPVYLSIYLYNLTYFSLTTTLKSQLEELQPFQLQLEAEHHQLVQEHHPQEASPFVNLSLGFLNKIISILENDS